MKGGKGLEGGDVGWQESSAASCTTPGGPFKSFTDWNGAGMIVFFLRTALSSKMPERLFRRFVRGKLIV